jgi:hypothetical protein
MINPQPYSHEDFVQNPGKYALFRTARIAEAISSSPELAVGQIVSIRYFATQLNKVRGDVDMPIYQVWPDANEGLKAAPVMLYACAMEGFTL